MLRWNGYAQNIADAFDIHGDGRFCGSGQRLHLRFEAVVIVDADGFPVIGDPDQDDPACGIRKGADFPSEV